MKNLTKRSRELYQLDKYTLINMIINYEEKCKDMGLEDMIEHEEKYPGKSKWYYNRQDELIIETNFPISTNKISKLSESEKADIAMEKFTKNLFKNRGNDAKHKIIKSEGKKTTKSCKRCS